MAERIDVVAYHTKADSDELPKDDGGSVHVEKVDGNLHYDNEEEEPELHFRTYIAVGSVIVFTFAGLWSLQGPPSVLTYIGQDLNGTATQTWIQTALVLPQSIFAPIIASMADTFQMRKSLIVIFAMVSFVGAAIAPGSTHIGRLIAAQVLVGFGFVVMPLAQVIPSEILPRKWRPMAQASINFGGSFGAIASPVIIGALTLSNAHTGWRTFFWIEMGLWGLAALGILFCYRPPKRHTKYDHLSLLQKLGRLDLVGSALLTIGLTLFMVGANLGESLYHWTDAVVLAPLVIGIAVVVVFCLYEWKGTATGILHHDLFRGDSTHGRTVAICLLLMAAEGALMFAFIIYYPILTTTVFETNPLRVVSRSLPFWGLACLSSIVWGYISTKLRNISYVLSASFIVFTAGLVGIATVQPNTGANAIIFAGLAGIGFGGPVSLVMAAVQLAPPHHLIATASALNFSIRAIGSTTFTAIYAATFQARLSTRLPEYIASAALTAGLPQESLGAFIRALTSHNSAALADIPGATPAVIGVSVAALKQAFADSLRIVFIIASPVGVVSAIACLFMGSLRKTMSYKVDAPIEDLHAKSERHQHELHAAERK